MKTAEETKRFLAEMDRQADTADPDEEDTAGPDSEGFDPDLDTADPDEEDTAGPDDEDTAAPNFQAQIKAVMDRFHAANGGRAPTRPQLQGMLQFVAQKAKSRPRRVVTPTSTVQIRRPLTPRVRRFRNDAFTKFRKAYNGKTVTTKGYYYSTGEIVFHGVGDKEAAGLIVHPTTINFFHEAIDDDSYRLRDKDGKNGIAHTVNPGETNLQNPGKNLFPRELFIITHVGLEFCGMRVMYDAAEVDSLKLDDDLASLLKGNGTVWDDGKVFLPGELTNDFDGRCRLVDSLYPSGVLFFAWDRKPGGGSKDMHELLISTMQKIPITRMGLTETSGGANLLEMNEGYVWTLDPQTAAGQSGIFQARIRIHERVTFPINPIEIKGMKLVPKRISALLRMTVYGDAIRPADDLVQAPEARARR